MNAMIVGGGGREHALACGIEKDVERLFVAPGNAGTETIAENVPIEATDIKGLVEFASNNCVDLTIIGPDDALALGLADELEAKGIAVFGPTKAAAQIESSKAYSKDIMREQSVPTADYSVFESSADALCHSRTASYPLVVKADGLALGKGVIICNSTEAAEQAIKKMMTAKKFGSAGNKVIIESYLDGPEVSLHAFCDGSSYELFPAAQDHKAIYEGNRGPMTGGMGTVAPLPWLSPIQIKALGDKILAPALAGLKNDNASFKGLLFPGLKMTSAGPKVLEYNARFGDPETQVYMKLLKSSLLKTIIACTDGNLEAAKPEWNSRFAVCVVVASDGYPSSSSKGDVIEGLDQLEKQRDITIFHAGTKRESGKIVTNGGRVLGVTAVADSIEWARTKAYDAIDSHINFKGMQFRRDIGLQAIRGYN